MSKIFAIIQARMESTRLPGKVLKKLHGKSIISLIVKRLHRSSGLDELLVAIPDNSSNLVIKEHLKTLNVRCIQGSENNLIQRFKKVADITQAKYIVRVTADCPFVDPEVIDKMIKLIRSKNLDYITNVIPPSWPDGLDISIFSVRTLNMANKNVKSNSDKEHLVPWIWRNSTLMGSNKIKADNYMAPYDMSSHRWTLDTEKDLLFFEKVSSKLSQNDLQSMNWKEFMDFFTNNPDITKINSDIVRDEGLIKSLKMEEANEV